MLELSTSIYPFWRDTVQPITGSLWQWARLLYLHVHTIIAQGLFPVEDFWGAAEDEDNYPDEEAPISQRQLSGEGGRCAL